MTKHRLMTVAVIAAGALAVVAAVQAPIPDGSERRLPRLRR